jgi:Aspartyl protease
MRVDGMWRLCDDGIVRPVITAEVLSANGSWLETPLIADTGADRTVFSADIVRDLNLPPLTTKGVLEGVGGRAASVSLQAKMRLITQDGGAVLFNAVFVGVTDPTALDMSVLGRDITNLFALIVDRPQDVVCLLGQRHRYTITEI